MLYSEVLSLVLFANLYCLCVCEIMPSDHSGRGHNIGLGDNLANSLIPLVQQQSHYVGRKHKAPGYSSVSCHLDTLSWVVKISAQHGNTKDFVHEARKLANVTGLILEGQVGHFSDIFLFVHLYHKQLHSVYQDYLERVYIHGNNDLLMSPETLHDSAADSVDDIKYKSRSLHIKSHDQTVTDKVWQDTTQAVQRQLDAEASVEWYTRQSVRRRTKRSLKYNDPKFDAQWHLVNREENSMDINVTGVWDRGVTGTGVVVVVVDDGLEWTVPDIQGNYNSKGSWDLNSNDDDPRPDTSNPHNHHGTRCAGEIAAVANNRYCGVGVAYNAGIAGIRVLDGPMTDSLEATAFTKNFDINDIYSCSWGPDDDGKTVDGPHHLANLALRHGVDFGRQGYGSIYVVASGNGGSAGDNCNYDGYANSIFTITIGAVDETEHMPYYAEECASMLAVTFSSGSSLMRSIVTTDWLSHDGVGCTMQHTGTSAAAPLAAGMIALMLSARPCLTWRDVQHLIVITAVKVDVDIAQWQKNAAGLHHSHKHGFGLMDSWRLVNAAKVWEPVPWMTVYASQLQTINDHISARSTLSYTHDVTTKMLAGYNLYTLEYVQVTVTIQHKRRGDLQIQLYCPSNTHSVLGAYRPEDDSGDGFDAWTFSTVRCWGEKPEGQYRIEVHDRGEAGMNRGILVSWRLKLFGSALSFDEMQQRMQNVKNSYSGQFLNNTYQAPCPPPPRNVEIVAPLSEKILKILVLTGAFATFMAVYESFEYIFCYDNEKKEHSKLMSLRKQAQGLVRNRVTTEDNGASPERQTLLHSMESYDGTGEMIPLQDLPSTTASAPAIQNDDFTSAYLFNGTSLTDQHTQPTNHLPSQINTSKLKLSKHPNGKIKNLCKHNHEQDMTGEGLCTNERSDLTVLSGIQTASDKIEYDEFVSSDDFLQ